MSMEIPICSLSDFLKQLLVIHCSNKLNAFILREMKFLVQSIQELLILCRNDCKIFCRMTLHKFKSSHTNVEFSITQSMFIEPADIFRIIILHSRWCRFRTIRNKSSLWLITCILFLNILFNILTVTNTQIRIFYHHTF